MNLALQYERDLQSAEGQALLKELSKYAHKIEEALSFDRFVDDIKSLSEQDFYTSGLLRTEVSRINEQEVAAIAGNVESEIESVVGNANILPKGNSDGILGMLKDLWNSLTEGGSTIGILQLVLDFVGLVGDAFLVVGLPLGMIADFINAMIYFFRGKHILGVISLIAMIPFGGDVAKGFKGVAGAFSKPFSKIFTKGAGKEIAEESATVLMKQEGKTFAKSKRFLEYIKKSAAKIAANISSAISFLLENVVAKAVGWVPFIGKPLKKFLTKIANYGRIVADNLTTFAKTVDAPIAKAVTKEAKASFDAMEIALTKGGKVVKEGDKLVVKEASGKIAKEIPIDEVAKFSNISKKFPDGPMSKVLKTGDDVARFYTFISKTGGKASKFLGKNADVILYRGLRVRGFKSFIAKQIVKLLGSSAKAMSDYELEGMTDIVTTDQLNSKMAEHAANIKKKTGATYVVPYIDQQLKDDLDTDLKEDELVYDLQKHLEYNAQRMGLPSFGSYIYARAKEEKEKEMEELYTSDQISDEKYNEIMGITGKGAKQFESISYSRNLKYIKPFNL